MKYLPTLNVLPDPRQTEPPEIISFSRNSRAYCVGSDGYLYFAESDEVRHEYNPVTREYLGWLIENSSVNQIGFSEDLTAVDENGDKYWKYENSFKTAYSVSTNDEIYPFYYIDIVKAEEATRAPNKRYEAFKLKDVSLVYAYRRVALTPRSFLKNSSVVFSIYAKAAEYNIFKIETSNWAGKTIKATFNLDTGVIEDVSTTATIQEVVMEPLVDGWHRLSIRYNTENGTTLPLIRLILVSDKVTYQEKYVGNQDQGVYIWGPQLEYRACESSYIPTTTLDPAKREADDMGFVRLDWFNEAEGSFVFESAVKTKIIGIHRILNLTNQNPDTFLMEDAYAFITAMFLAERSLTTTIYDSPINGLTIVPTGYYPRVRIVSKVLTSTDPETYTTQDQFLNINYDQRTVEANTFYKMGLSYKTHDVKYFLNGIPTPQDNYCQLPPKINMGQIARGGDISSLETGGDYLNGYIRRILYYNSKLPEDFLVELTT